MGKISVADIQPGMMVEHDIKNHLGLTLLKKGHKLSQQNIRLLKMWGITEVEINNGHEQESTANKLAKIDPGVKAKADNLFRHCQLQHPAIQQLYRLSLLRLTRQKANGR